jgi:hypothetical protein
MHCFFIVFYANLKEEIDFEVLAELAISPQ